MKQYRAIFFDHNEDVAEVSIWALNIKEAKKRAAAIKYYIRNFQRRPAGNGPLKSIVKPDN